MADFDVKIRISAVDLVKGVARGVTSSVKKITTAVQKLDAAGQKLQRTGSAIQSAGTAMATAGAAVIAPLALATKSFAQFETGIAKIATLGTDTVPQAMSKLGEAVKNLSAESGQKIGILNDALFDAQSAGFKGAEGLAVMRAATISATGGFTQVSNVLPAITKSLLAYGQNGFQAGKLIDQFAISNELGVLTIEELASSLPNIASSAAQLNIPMSQLLGTVTGMSTQSKSVTNAINNLNAALAGISTPTTDAVAQVKELNKNLPTDKQFEFDTAALMRKGLVPFFKELKQVTGGSKIAIDKLFGSIEARRGVGALLGSMDVIEKATARNEKATNAATLANSNYQKALGTLQGRINRMTATINIMAIEVGSVLAPVVISAATKIIEVAQAVRTWRDENQIMFSRLIKGAAAVGSFLVVVGGLAIALGAIIKVVGVFAIVAGKVGFVVAALGKLWTLLTVLGTVISVLGIKFFIIAAAISVAIFAVAAFASGVIGFFVGFIEGLTGAETGIQGVGDLFKWLAGIVKTVVVGAFNILFKVIKKIFGVLGKIFQAGARLGKFLGSGLRSLFTDAGGPPDGVTGAGRDVSPNKAIADSQKAGKGVIAANKATQKGNLDSLKAGLAAQSAAKKTAKNRDAGMGLEAGTFGITALSESQKRLFFGGMEPPESGSASRGLESSFTSALLSASGGKQGGQVFNIDKIELPAVNAAQFVEDMAEIGGGRKG